MVKRVASSVLPWAAASVAHMIRQTAISALGSAETPALSKAPAALGIGELGSLGMLCSHAVRHLRNKGIVLGQATRGAHAALGSGGVLPRP